MNKKIFKRIFSYLGKYKLLFLLSIICALISVSFTLYIPILFGEAIDFIVAKNNVNFDAVKSILFRAFISVVAICLFQYLMGIINNKIAFKMSKRVRDDVFSNLQKLPLKYIDGKQTGELISRIIGDVDIFCDGLLLGFSQLLTGVLTILGTLIFMYLKNPIIATVVVVVTPISLFVSRFIAQKTSKMFKKQSEIKGEQTAFTDEMINSLKTVIAYNHEDENQDKFDEINGRLKQSSFKATFYSSLTNPLTRFVNSIVYVCVALTGGILAVSGSGIFLVTAGTLSSLLAYANQYTKPFNEISSVLTELTGATVSAGRVFDLIDEKQEVDDSKNKELNKVDGFVNIKDVNFSYVKEKKLIQNFNLSVSKGKMIAIVGPTGCGKTTLINLLMRFYDVDSGEISIDNNNIIAITRRSLRENIGMVLQETFIKNATVRENIAIGKKDATEEEIIEACKAVYADSFIRRQQNGYDTVISEDGNLSQGEKQLICIARVMLLKPPMLILDEATSSIDVRTEIKIQKAFAKLMEGRTSFVVAHRLSTIKDADVILVMKDGNVIEQGSHKELIDKGEFYYKLFNSQFEK